MAVKGGESRAGLVVFLVLFILLSIGLGVMVYLDQDKIAAAEGKADKEEKNAKAWTTTANYFQFLALTYRSYLGQPPTQDDLGNLRSQWDSKKFDGARDDKGKETHKATLEAFDKGELAWDGQQNKPKKSYQDRIAELEDKLKKANEATAAAGKEAARMKEESETAKRALEDANKKFVADLGRQNAEAQKAIDAKEQAIKQLQEDLRLAGEKGKEGVAPLQKQIADLTNENKGLRKERDDAHKTLREKYQVAERNAPQVPDLPKGHVFKIDSTGEMPYIDLGSEDNLKTQVTFSVHGKGVDGKPLPQSKVGVEVVRVVGDHLSQVRILMPEDPKERRRVQAQLAADPVLAGDFLFNPAWSPNLKQHVAVVGIIDLTGDGHDNTQEFLRQLKLQNVVVDAWLDMKSLKMTGEVTRQTDLLVVGGYPDFGTGVIVKDNDPKTEKKNAALKAMTDAQEQAAKLGVRIVRLNDFLAMSGYPLPKRVGGAARDYGQIDFHKSLPATNSPNERRDVPKMAPPPGK
jgi:hypothetical protein